ncbi:CHAT domain-containing protein [Saccharothrix carnea]|uniref:CHAT domain-containing protein n=2 Tax=Saccharothrix carnea TaxID=1280637 RepID=A0A2P8IF75_SACCR|nr:CHAT domain-containing protein [Saccharothrix carnea]
MPPHRLAELLQARENGNTEAAALIARSALTRAVREHDLPSMLFYATELDSLTGSVLDPVERLGPWEELRSAARRLDSPAMEFAASVQLAVLHLASDDAELATRHLTALLDLATENTDPLWGLLDPTATDTAIHDLLQDLYYRREDFTRVAAVAAKLTERHPDLRIAWFYLGHSLNRLDRFDEAIPALRRLSDFNPTDPGPHIAVSRALAGTDRFGEAIAAASKAIELRPENTQYRFIRAQIEAGAGRLDQALQDLDHVIADCERQSPDGGPPVPHLSYVEYMRNVPTRDQADQARVMRVQVLMSDGRRAEARAEAEHLVLSGELLLAMTGHLFLGRVAQAEARHEDAVAHFGEHLRICTLLDQDRTDGLLGRATSLEALDRLDDAIADIDALSGVGPGFDAAAAVEALTALSERHPGHAGVRKALGHALLDNFVPGRAAEILNAMHQEDPSDWQITAWLAMTMVTSSDTEEDWNSEFSTDRVLRAITLLAAAVELAPDEHFPRSRLRWLVDRACVIGPVAHRVMLSGPQDADRPEADVRSAMPELDEPFRAWRQAVDYEVEDRWADAVALLTSARAAFVRIGLPVLTAMADLRLADNLLRLYDMRGALDHLDAADGALGEIGMLPDMIRGGVDMLMTDAQSAGDQVLWTDIDHKELSDTVALYFLSTARMLRAQWRHRVGDFEGALDELSITTGHDFEWHYFRIIALRDADRPAEAAELLPVLRELATPGDEIRLANLTATVQVALNDPVAAMGTIENAMATLDPQGADAAGLATNLQLTYLDQDRPDDVLAIAHRFPLPPGMSIRGVYGRLNAVALAQSMRGDHADALHTLTEALDLIDRVRGTLHDEQARMTWQQAHLFMYRRAIHEAAEAGLIDAALDLVERAKARAFVDQLGLDSVEPTERVLDLRADVDRARRRLGLLTELTAAPQPELELDLISRIDQLRPFGRVSLDELDTELRRGRDAVDRLTGALARETVQGRDSVAGPTLSTDEIHALLGPGCVLAEYYVAAEATTLFVLTPDNPVPAMHVIAHGEDLVAATVDRQLGTAHELDPVAFEKTFRPFVAPIAEYCAPGEVIVLVPHGALHLVPLHALLLDRNPVCHLPSSSLLRYRQRTPSRGWRTAIVFGDSRSDLSHARQEAAEVAAVFGGVGVVGDDASRARLLDALAERPDVVHLACHGRFDREHPMDSAVLLAPAGTRHDGELTAADLVGLTVDANLVTLSACESGVSTNHPGDELIGLARATLYAGVPSLVVSLWEVDDLSTAFLMTHFYRLLRGGATPADALRTAQLRLASTTARHVVTHCDTALAATTDPVITATLLLARAGAQAKAGDVAAALASCRRVDLAAARGDVAARLRARTSRQTSLLTLKSEAELVVDYSARPFAHPYHWAAFVLIGDWR